MRFQNLSTLALAAVTLLAVAAGASTAPLGYSVVGNENDLQPVWAGDELVAQGDPVQLFLTERGSLVLHPHSTISLRQNESQVLVEVLAGSLASTGKAPRVWTAGSTASFGGGGDAEDVMEDPPTVASDVESGETSVPVSSTDGLNENAAILLGGEVHCIDSLAGDSIELKKGLGASIAEGSEILQGEAVSEALDSGDAEDRTDGDCDLEPAAGWPYAQRAVLIGAGVGAIGTGIAVVNDDNREPSTTIEVRTP